MCSHICNKILIMSNVLTLKFLQFQVWQETEECIWSPTFQQVLLILHFFGTLISFSYGGLFCQSTYQKFWYIIFFKHICAILRHTVYGLNFLRSKFIESIIRLLIYSWNREVCSQLGRSYKYWRNMNDWEVQEFTDLLLLLENIHIFFFVMSPNFV